MSSMNFIRTLIRERMEDPAEREAKWVAHLRGVEAAAARIKVNLTQPTKPWGFWRNEKRTGKYETNADPAVSKMPGRLSGAARISGE